MSSKMFKRHFCRSQNFFKTHLTPFFNVVFNADSESVFKNFLSHLEPIKSELKILKIISIAPQHTQYFYVGSSASENRVLSSNAAGPSYKNKIGVTVIPLEWQLKDRVGRNSRSENLKNNYVSPRCTFYNSNVGNIKMGWNKQYRCVVPLILQNERC